MSFWITQYLKSMGDNFGQVTPLIYRSAQPSSARLIELRKKHNVLVNLNLRDDFTQQDRLEILRVGIIPYNIPLSDKEAPTVEDVEKALKILSTTGKDIVLVNCKGGRHRTGLIIACYRYRFD